jgi:phospholipid/cholesterol/gamma-HCH transport system substrate-binding protein
MTVMGKRNIEILVGLFVLLGMLGLAFLAIKAANVGAVSGSNHYEISARFDNVGGLKPRAPIRTAGVTVGRVKSISLDPKTFQGVVVLDIDGRYQFPKDTAAKILTSGLLGDQYIGMEPGGDDKVLVAGDTVAQTQSAVVLENLIGQMMTGKAGEAAGGGAAAAAGGAAASGGTNAAAASSAGPAAAAASGAKK